MFLLSKENREGENVYLGSCTGGPLTAYFLTSVDKEKENKELKEKLEKLQKEYDELLLKLKG